MRLTGIGKDYGSTPAVHKFDLDIRRGSFVAIMGPSGCGKTTLLRMIAGLETPTRGQIILNGESIESLPPWKRRMPLVWQSYALFPFLSVIDNVAFGLRNESIGKSARLARAQTWLDRLGIGNLAHRSPGTLSGGQAQRVALARALVLEPEILLLDEPLSALDANMVVRMQTELAQLQRDLGITFFYVTHNQSEAFAMADTVVIMNGGNIEQVGSPMAVYKTPRTRFVAGFVGTNNIVDGVIAAADGGSCRIETVLGPFTTATPLEGDATIGRGVHLVVGADVITVSTKPLPTSANEIPGRLIGESFAGNVALLVFEAASGTELRAQVPHRVLAELGLSLQQPAYLSFEPTDALLIPARQISPSPTEERP
jgi:spermidine/putrescine transport system ATP-binding protein